MPHCILEYSENVINASRVISLLKVIHGTLANSLLFDKKNIKVRAIKYTDYLVNNNKEDFVHLQVAILAGRKERQKVLLSNTLLTNLSKIITNCNNITIEIRDINKALYSKK